MRTRLSRATGNLHRPRRYNRQLQRVFYTSALISIQRSPASKAFYDRKRAEGKRHSQAVLALARRRVNLIWAMLRDQQTYAEPGGNQRSPLDKETESQLPTTSQSSSEFRADHRRRSSRWPMPQAAVDQGE
jgi:hypothetical protein